MRLAGVMRLGRVMMRGGTFLFQFIESFFIRVIALGQFSFVEIIRRIVVAEIRIACDVFFGLLMCRFIWIGGFLFCHFYRF